MWKHMKTDIRTKVGNSGAVCSRTLCGHIFFSIQMPFKHKGQGHFYVCVRLWSIGFGNKNRARRLFFFCLKCGGVYFGIKTLIKDVKNPNDFKWLLKTWSDFQKLLHYKNMGMLHIKRKLVIRVTHWKWENGILRSSEVIRGQKPQKMTNRKIFCSTLFMQRVLLR